VYDNESKSCYVQDLDSNEKRIPEDTNYNDLMDYNAVDVGAK